MLSIARRAFLAAVLALLCLAGLTVSATSADAYSLPRRPSGSVLENPHLIGETPVGFRIYLDPHATAGRTLALKLAADARELRSYGFNISYRGQAAVKLGEGIIYVQTGKSGCTSNGGKSGAETYPYWQYITASTAYMTQAHIIICPTMFTRYPSWELTPMLKHELGHALGLGHQNSKVAGRYQIMRWVITAGITDYQAGDRAGLRWLARNADVVKASIRPLGQWLQWDPVKNVQTRTWSYTITGWALLKYSPTQPVTITLTRDKHVISRAQTRYYRSNINRAYRVTGDHGFQITTGTIPAGRHTYCLSATSSISSASTTNLGCAVLTA